MLMLPIAILHYMRLMLTSPGLRSTPLIMLPVTVIIMDALTMIREVMLMRLRLRLVLLLLLLSLLLLPIISGEILSART